MSNINEQNLQPSEAIFKKLVQLTANSVQLQNITAKQLLSLKDLILHFQTTLLQDQHPNPLNRFGQKCFSQTDEDGITTEILRRLSIDKGVYAEFGVGNGLENNTLILAAMGWRGFWVGGEDLAFKFQPSRNFNYIKTWITKDNIFECARSGMRSTETEEVDVLSLDLDGNDIYFISELLEKGIRPKLCIVEYNAQFIPPARFQITYDPDHNWKDDNYFGAALSNFNTLFNRFGYRLVCCNSHTGANAFFVDNTYDSLFRDVPTDIREIYSSPRYHLYTQYGHRQSPKTVECIFAALNQTDSLNKT
jgi:hypothetical protein